MFDLSRFSLQGKVAIVTGGGRGIGKAIAQGFAKAGAEVAITSRKINDLEATAAELAAFGGVAFPVQSHLGRTEEIGRMVGAVMEQGGGKIINVASSDGFKPEPGVSVYSISKAGVRMITSAFAMELAPFNIQVNTIAPGPISTKMWDPHWFHLPP